MQYYKLPYNILIELISSSFAEKCTHFATIELLRKYSIYYYSCRQIFKHKPKKLNSFCLVQLYI